MNPIPDSEFRTPNSFCLPPRITANDALRIFTRPRFRNLYGLLAPQVHVAVAKDTASRVPPFIERLWLPAYAIRVRAVTRKGERDVWATVEGFCGEVSIFEAEDELVPFTLDDDAFTPALDAGQAVDLARRGLLRYIMSQRGQANKPITEAVEEIKPYLFPLWVLFFLRRRKKIDLKVLDARTGKSAGAKMRVAVINALIAARKTVK